MTGIQGDVTKLADIDRLYQAIKAKGRIDRFAAAGFSCSPGKHHRRAFRQAIQHQCEGLLFTVQKALPLLRDGGSIILNVVASIKGTPAFGVYSA